MTTNPFPAPWLQKYSYEQLERLAIKTESGISDDEAVRQMIREEKIERYLKNEKSISN